jgi:hypothetical protein
MRKQTRKQAREREMGQGGKSTKGVLINFSAVGKRALSCWDPVQKKRILRKISKEETNVGTQMGICPGWELLTAVRNP